MRSAVSIVIVSYNVCGLLRQCLKSIYDQQIDAEVIVVDNASSDDSVNMVRSEFAAATLIVNTGNVGFSAANNQGIAASTGERILLLNPDTELTPGALQKLLHFAAQQAGLTLIGPQLLNSDHSLQISAWKSPSPLDMILESAFLHRIFRTSEYGSAVLSNSFEPGMLSGAALLFSRELHKQIGGLDPQLFWMEDADYAYRTRKAGGRILYYPEAKIVHHSGQSSKKNLTIVISNQLISKLKYYRKHWGVAALLLASLFCLLHIVTRIVLFGILAIAGKDYARKCAAYVGALPRFFSYLFTGNKRVT